MIEGVSVEDLRNVIAACAGNNFRERRDTAFVLFVVDTGDRLGEVAGFDLADVDKKSERVDVCRKGRNSGPSRSDRR